MSPLKGAPMWSRPGLVLGPGVSFCSSPHSSSDSHLGAFLPALSTNKGPLCSTFSLKPPRLTPHPPAGSGLSPPSWMSPSFKSSCYLINTISFSISFFLLLYVWDNGKGLKDQKQNSPLSLQSVKPDLPEPTGRLSAGPL